MVHARPSDPSQAGRRRLKGVEFSLLLAPVLIKAHSILLGALLALLVGLSPVYLGVHWPGDVLGGWLLGALWAAFALLLSRWWRRRAKP